MKKLKSIAKILQENPDAYFLTNGDLKVRDAVLAREVLHQFGKETSEFWYDFMFEPEPEKIVIVKMVVEGGKIIECKKGTEDHRYYIGHNWKTLSEYTIERQNEN